ncbi:MAG TPA: hypothetical protein VHH53_08520, partial [Pseudonocardiaceae bacterium]|nr:hypothetical protein [Pseudonocardiaceae bacterium]
MTDRLATLPSESKAYRTSGASTLGIDEAQEGSESGATRRPFCALDEASYHLDSISEPWSVHLEVRL